MALIICPECGKRVSDAAPACIHCGCPTDKMEEKWRENAEKLTPEQYVELIDESTLPPYRFYYGGIPLF